MFDCGLTSSMFGWGLTSSRFDWGLTNVACFPLLQVVADRGLLVLDTSLQEGERIELQLRGRVLCGYQPAVLHNTSACLRYSRLLLLEGC
jgi:hypothetical protein